MSPSQFRSQVESLAFPALADSIGMSMLGLHYQLARTQWLDPEALLALQLRQLGSLLAHAAAQVPHYRGLPARIGWQPGHPLTLESFRRIPVLRRSEVQAKAAELRAATVPREHGAVTEARSSGSTGRPVAVAVTEVTGLMWEAIALRDNLWHRRDLGLTLAALRSRAQPPGPRGDGLAAPVWNRGVGAAFVNGTSLMFRGNAPVREQVEWVTRKQPDYMLLHPTVLREMLDEFAKRRLKWERLKAVITYSEQLPPGLRERVMGDWGVPLQDTYSAREIGYMALQCPEHPHYHVQAESVFVEILDHAGDPCPPGAAGRVIVTPLHNFAMPLLRYEIGDFAEPGARCRCDRGLPVLTRILGRTRNMLRLPSGDGRWLDLMPLERRAGLPIAQYQLVQHDYATIEARLVAERKLAPREEALLRDLVARCGAGGFAIAISYHDALPRSEGGKFEDFVCAIPPGDRPARDTPVPRDAR